MSQGSVYDLMHKKGKFFSGRELLSIITQTAVGMNYLHSFRPPVLHRDLKVYFSIFFRFGYVFVRLFVILSIITQTAVVMNYLHSFRPPVLHGDLKVYLLCICLLVLLL
jgi:serine/threonine protein kinase